MGTRAYLRSSDPKRRHSSSIPIGEGENDYRKIVGFEEGLLFGLQIVEQVEERICWGFDKNPDIVYF